MKVIIRTITLAALVSTGAIAQAHDKDLGGNPDLYGSPLLEHKAASRGGEGQKGTGDLYGSHIANPMEVAPDPNAKPEPIDRRNALHDQDPEGYGLTAN